MVLRVRFESELAIVLVVELQELGYRKSYQLDTDKILTRPELEGIIEGRGFDEELLALLRRPHWGNWG